MFAGVEYVLVAVYTVRIVLYMRRGFKLVSSATRQSLEEQVMITQIIQAIHYAALCFDSCVNSRQPSRSYSTRPPFIFSYSPYSSPFPYWT